MQPRRPHGQSSPPSTTTTWPISPAAPWAPMWSWPPRIRAPPTPEPANTTSRSSKPRPAPRRCSARVATTTSLPTTTRLTPRASATSAPRGTGCPNPGRLAALTTPAISATTAAGPPSTGVLPLASPSLAPSWPTITPWTLVPPRSTPAVCMTRMMPASSERWRTESAPWPTNRLARSRRLGNETKQRREREGEPSHVSCHRARRHHRDAGRAGRPGDQGLRAGPDRGASAGQRLGRVPERPLHGHHGSVRFGQVDADALPGRAGPDHLGADLHRRRRAQQAVREAAHPAPPGQGGLRVPGLQPAPDPDRGRERRAAPGHRRPQARPGLGGPGGRRRRAARAPEPQAGRAVRRPAAAGGRGPGPGLQAGDRVRRRADRQPRLGLGHRAARLHAPLGRRVRPDHRDGHPRPQLGRLRRPRAVPGRRPDRRRDGQPDRREGPRPDEEAGRLAAMGKATIKGLLAHKLRLAATALAIVLGVSFVAGTYVLTDTITASFDNLFKQVTQGIDVAVRSQETFGGFDTGEVRDPMPEEVLNEVKGVDGVRVAEGSVTGYAQLVGKDGKAVTTGGAPSLGVSFNQDTAFTAGSTIRSGRLPSGPGELAIDAKTATDTGYAVGDRVKVLFQGPARTFTVSGIIGFGQADNLGGARLVGFDLPTAQELLNRNGKFDEIDAAAAEGVTPEQLRDRVRAALDSRYEVLTGSELAEDTAAQINDTIGRFLSTALLAFAFVALLVGGFLIFNTFTIIVAQRTRELALLPSPGPPARQVLHSLPVAGVTVAVPASLVGLGLGVLIASGLKALLSTFLGGDIPTTGVQFQPRTVVVSLLVGLVVTVLAAVIPALKATRVPPVAALQPETAFAPTGFRKRRIVVGVLVTVVGIGLLLAGLFRPEGNRLANVASGAVVVFFSVAILSPLIARPLARVIGWPFARAFRLPGTLAQQNAMRNPRRTASTAAALMIGLALVAFVSIFAASIKASTTRTLEDTVSADYILFNDQFQPFSPEAAERLAQQPQLAAVAGMRIGAWKLNGAGRTLYGVDPAAYQQVVKTETTAGSLNDLASGGLAVKDTVAKANGWTWSSPAPASSRSRSRPSTRTTSSTATTCWPCPTTSGTTPTRPTARSW